MKRWEIIASFTMEIEAENREEAEREADRWVPEGCHLDEINEITGWG